MNAIYDVIRKAFSLIFGPVLYAFYNLTGSYVLSIVALTLIIRLLLLPVSISAALTLCEVRHRPW